MNKIKVALVFEDKSTAKSFVANNAPNGEIKRDYSNEFVYETPMLHFEWIKPFLNYKGQRFNFVFTNEVIRDTDWFDTVIRPMQIVGTGAIDQRTIFGQLL